MEGGGESVANFMILRLIGLGRKKNWRYDDSGEGDQKWTPWTPSHYSPRIDSSRVILHGLDVIPNLMILKVSAHDPCHT